MYYIFSFKLHSVAALLFISQQQQPVDPCNSCTNTDALLCALTNILSAKFSKSLPLPIPASGSEIETAFRGNTLKTIEFKMYLMLLKSPTYNSECPHKVPP